jgi:hypothetical protein
MCIFYRKREHRIDNDGDHLNNQNPPNESQKVREFDAITERLQQEYYLQRGIISLPTQQNTIVAGIDT